MLLMRSLLIFLQLGAELIDPQMTSPLPHMTSLLVILQLGAELIDPQMTSLLVILQLGAELGGAQFERPEPLILEALLVPGAAEFESHLLLFCRHLRLARGEGGGDSAGARQGAGEAVTLETALRLESGQG